MYLNHIKAQERYQALVHAIKPFTSCWNQSVIQAWPAGRDALPGEWLAALDQLTLPELHELDECIASGGLVALGSLKARIPESLLALLSLFEGLIHFPMAGPQQDLPAAARQRMTEKKQQEIASILPFIREQARLLHIERGLDIGGGAGHLARCLVSELSLPMVSIDRDAALQNLGRELLQKLKMAEGSEGLRFVAGEILPELQPHLDSHFQGSCLSLGLHTCGPLALAHLRKSQQSLCLLNFGCCYDRMVPAQDLEVSAWAQQHPLEWTSYALFLATRGRRRTLAELAMQERVNTYRMALHLFLQDSGLCRGFISVGDANRAAYSQGFAEYAQDRFQALGFSAHFDLTSARLFIEDKPVGQAMREFFLSNILRNCFARPLEVLILLDRALWLLEQGREVSILQFFEMRVSPRNLGIYAHLA